MSKPLIRVTQLEAFRRYLDNGDHSYFEIKEEDVIDTICGGFTGNNYTRIGTALHRIIERGKPTYEREGYAVEVDTKTVIFDEAQLRVAMEYRDEFPFAYHEVRTCKDYGEAVVTGCADMINGLEIRDIKTRFSAPNDADYMDSYQWRFYLDLFSLNTFHFDLFIFKGYGEKRGHDVRGLQLERYQPAITRYRYPGMEADNRELVRQFMEWAKARDLLQHLPTINL